MPKQTRPLPFAPGSARIVPADGESPKGNAFCVEAPDGQIYYAYRYPHPAVAATVVLKDRRRGAYLLIERRNDPFSGRYAFPGGFLNVGCERIEQTAARELEEETGVRVDAKGLLLIDVRSDPARDPRDHVFDIGYYAEVDAADAAPLDETSAVRWASADEIETLALAFDHADLWRAVKARVIDADRG
jgi:8-oxo-dGTP diphosphatase